MPIYLCKPGWGSPEPWRHGVPVYALPFPFDSNHPHNNATNHNNNNNNHNSNANAHYNGNDSQVQMHQYEDVNTRYTTHTLVGTSHFIQEHISPPATFQTRHPADAAGNVGGTGGGVSGTGNDRNGGVNAHAPTVSHTGSGTGGGGMSFRGSPIRRVKHAEVVLVDEVSVHYGNFWLRLRWPGKRGGVAGYIALGGVNVVPVEKVEEWKEKINNEGGMLQLDDDFSRVDVTDRMGRMNTSRSEQRDNVHQTGTFNSDQEPSIPEEDGFDMDDADTDALTEPHATAPMTTSQGLSQSPKCETTGLYFPSTAAMELLKHYDDGLTSAALLNSEVGAIALDDSDGDGGGKEGEPVFCRICREGLHDIDYDFELEGNAKSKRADANNINTTAATTANNNTFMPPLPATADTIIRQRGMNMHAVDDDNRENQNNINNNTTSASSTNPQSSMPFMMENHLRNESLNYSRQQQQHHQMHSSSSDATGPGTSSNNNPYSTSSKQSLLPKPADQINHPYAENPLLAPCECSGSMAFVHYLCIEQWRCRSHHPAAKNGLNCETCNASYTLPPPPSRPEAEEEDWMEAMPPHVLAALRHPHPCWQIGAAIVRRRWLRPIAPVLTSPIVALYCRARRTLKKRGVSRRRWACSLCRRRARWKCVRCLRSYYCSRQCQNVSWHIVHKHVCYKPGRFWWSVVVYGLAFVYFIPGVLSYPLIYDLGLLYLFFSFMLMGVIGGGIATLMKREVGIDIRGRTLEVSVVCLTLWMGLICWGLLWGFFGEADQCMGVMDKFHGLKSMLRIPSLSFWKTQSDESYSLSWTHHLLKNCVLHPSKVVMDTLDSGILKTGPFITNWICSVDVDESSSSSSPDSTSSNSCLQLTRKANPDFMLPEHDGGKCASDFNVVTGFCYLAVFVHVLGIIWKRRERNNRRGGGRHHPRPHQD